MQHRVGGRWRGSSIGALGCCQTDLYGAAAQRCLWSLCQACICNLTLSADCIYDGWMCLSRVKSPLAVTHWGSHTFILNLSKLCVIKSFHGLMNKVRRPAPLSRGWMDEALAPVPLLRSPTCSVHSHAYACCPRPLIRACKCIWTMEKSHGNRIPNLFRLRLTSPRCTWSLLSFFFFLFPPRELAARKKARDEAR